jgi:hypothetical protein
MHIFSHCLVFAEECHSRLLVFIMGVVLLYPTVLSHPPDAAPGLTPTACSFCIDASGRACKTDRKNWRERGRARATLCHSSQVAQPTLRRCAQH